MSGKNVRSVGNLASRSSNQGGGRFAGSALAVAGLAAVLLLAIGLSVLTACSSGPEPFVSGSYSPPPAATPQPIGPAPAQAK